MTNKIGYLKNETTNLGDAIQSLAAKKIIQSLGIIPVGIHKDELLGKGCPPSDVDALLINGWFTKDEFNGLISGKEGFQKVVTAGIHISDWDGGGETIDKGTEKHEGLDIGARDSGTKKILTENNYKAWISGCLTTTLSITNPVGRYRHKREGSKRRIALVDLDTNLPKNVLAKNNLEIFTHNECNTRYYTEEDAEERITEYSDFDMIATRRLHCALPMVGYGHNVLFFGNLKDYRIEPITTTGSKIKWYPSYRREISEYKRFLSTVKRYWWSVTAHKELIKWIKENGEEANLGHTNNTTGNAILLEVVRKRLRNAIT